MWSRRRSSGVKRALRDQEHVGGGLLRSGAIATRCASLSAGLLGEVLGEFFSFGLQEAVSYPWNLALLGCQD